MRERERESERERQREREGEGKQREGDRQASRQAEKKIHARTSKLKKQTPNGKMRYYFLKCWMSSPNLLFIAGSIQIEE